MVGAAATEYRAVLAAPRVRRPLAGSLVGRIPEAIVSVALVVLVKEATGSYVVAGAAASVYAIAGAVAAPVLGRVVDRVGQRRVLVPATLVFGGALVAMGLQGASLAHPALLALAAVAGASRPPLDSCLQALWPALVPGPRVQTAYALEATAQELIWIAGPLLLALLLAAGSAGLPMVVCAAMTAAGTAIYVTAPAARARRGERVERHWTGALAAPGVRVALAMGVLYGGGIGFLAVTLPAFAADHGGSAGAGVLIAVWGVGSLVGGLFYGSRRWRTPLHQRAVLLLAAFGVAVAALAAAPSFAALAGLIFLAGLPLSPWLATLNALTQEIAPRGMRTEAFTWLFASETGGTALGSAAAGLVVQGAGTGTAFLVAGVTACLGAALASTRPCVEALKGRPVLAR